MDSTSFNLIQQINDKYKPLLDSANSDLNRLRDQYAAANKAYLEALRSYNDNDAKLKNCKCNTSSPDHRSLLKTCSIKIVGDCSAFKLEGRISNFFRDKDLMARYKTEMAAIQKQINDKELFITELNAKYRADLESITPEAKELGELELQRIEQENKALQDQRNAQLRALELEASKRSAELDAKTAETKAVYWVIGAVALALMAIIGFVVYKKYKG